MSFFILLLTKISPLGPSAVASFLWSFVILLQNKDVLRLTVVYIESSFIIKGFEVSKM